MAEVVTTQKGGQIRLRGLNHDLPVHVSTEKGDISAVLKPNQWVSVPKEIFDIMKTKHSIEEFREVPDYYENERSPHKAGERPLTRTESRNQYIMEFRN